MSWVITEDFIDDGRAVGVMGPGSSTLSVDEVMGHRESKRFEMFDDDKVRYYAGFWLDDDHADSELDPLDDFGMPNAGCTMIKMGGRFV